MSGRNVGVLVVDDDAIVREWVRLLLEDSEFRIVGEASSSDGALAILERRRPDLLLVDYRLPDKVGIDLVRDLRQRGIATPAVIMTANPERGFNETAREAGAQGSILKTNEPAEILQILRAVAGGGAAFDHRHPRRQPGEAALSRRERDVLRLVARGATNREIAESLGIGSETVKTLLARVFAKLGVRRRVEAVTVGRERGFIA